MFPGPYSEIIRNEDGEPIGWDNHYYDGEPDTDPYDYADDDPMTTYTVTLDYPDGSD